MKKLVLGPMAVPSDGTDIIAAGPWCFAAEEDFFPYWEEHFEIAPEPFADRKLQKRAIGEAFALATDMIPRLAHHLAPKVALPDVYWETLLAPYCINVAKILVELTYRVRAMVDTYGAREIEVALLPDNCSFDMGCDQDVVLHGCLNPVCLHWLCSLLLRPMLPGAWHVMEADAVREDYPLHKPESFGERMRENLRNLALSLPCPPLRGMSMARAMRYSLALLHKSRGEDHSRSLRDHYSSKVTGAHIDLPLDPMPIFLALLPKSIRSLKHPKHAPGPKHKTRVAHILMYEDAHYRQKLALWRARGGRLACVQHGGNYGMMRHICAMELVEYTQHAFITWGWKHQESAVEGKCGKANFLPLPPAQLANVSNCWRGGSNNLILVGTEMPTVGYQLDCPGRTSSGLWNLWDTRYSPRRCTGPTSLFRERWTTHPGCSRAFPACVCAQAPSCHSFCTAACWSSITTEPPCLKPWQPTFPPSATGIPPAGPSTTTSTPCY